MAKYKRPRYRKKMKSSGRMITKKVECPFCHRDNSFRVKKFPSNSMEIHKTWRHCENCRAECHFTNYEKIYWHPVNKTVRVDKENIQETVYLHDVQAGN